MLVVLEGLDGAGKSTQVKKLKEYLESKCKDFNYIHFPRYEAPLYGDLISKFLRGGFGSIENVHPQLVALLFALDRQDAAVQIKSTLDKGGCVLLDRYVYSNIAYQCAKLDNEEEAEELRKWIIDTEYGRYDLPKPDLNIFLDVPIEFVEKNLKSQRDGDENREYLEGKQDIHEASIAFQSRVQKIYRRQAALDNEFVTIDCTDSNGKMLQADLIFEKIKNVIDSTVKCAE